jgi:hypothetical protein
MSDRSPTARPRPALAHIHHKAQIATYVFSGLVVVLAILSPDFARAAAAAFRAFIAIILN